MWYHFNLLKIPSKFIGTKRQHVEARSYTEGIEQNATMILMYDIIYDD